MLPGTLRSRLPSERLPLPFLASPPTATRDFLFKHAHPPLQEKDYYFLATLTQRSLKRITLTHLHKAGSMFLLFASLVLSDCGLQPTVRICESETDCCTSQPAIHSTAYRAESQAAADYPALPSHLHASLKSNARERDLSRCRCHAPYWLFLSPTADQVLQPPHRAGGGGCQCLAGRQPRSPLLWSRMWTLQVVAVDWITFDSGPRGPRNPRRIISHSYFLVSKKPKNRTCLGIERGQWTHDKRYITATEHTQDNHSTDHDHDNNNHHKHNNSTETGYVNSRWTWVL